jgi:hypothetical protein
LDRRLGGFQSRSGSGGEEKNSQPLPELEPLIIQHVARRYTIELSQLFENTVQKMMVGLKGEEYGGWRNLHNEELHILYASQNTIWVVESRRMPWVGHAASVRR